jgi:hypothetical protein
MKGNNWNSKEIQAVLNAYPKSFETTIPVTNEDFYNIIGANKVSGAGLLDNTIHARIFTVDVLAWESKKEYQKTAVSFGFEQIMILHNPTLKPAKPVKKVKKVEVTEAEEVTK